MGAISKNKYIYFYIYNKKRIDKYFNHFLSSISKSKNLNLRNLSDFREV
jgi:hypothetical protein